MPDIDGSQRLLMCRPPSRSLRSQGAKDSEALIASAADTTRRARAGGETCTKSHGHDWHVGRRRKWRLTLAMSAG